MSDVKKKINKNEVLFLLILFFILICWMVALPYNDGPDEHMRYAIPKFIYQYGYIPRGDDPRIIDPTWGFSYAFSPILTYMISALFMKIGSFFNSSDFMLLMYARFVSVVFSMLTAYIALKIADKLFSNSNSKWLFVFLITFLPQFQFISSYVNCDAIAVFCVSLIIYYIIEGHENNWKYKTCIYLGLSIGVCLLSYYNTYGVILVTVIYCILDVCSNCQIQQKFSFIIKRFFLVFLAAFVIAGWWFIRNMIIYNGDILGRKAASLCAEVNAIPSFKPSQKKSLFASNVSIFGMLFGMNWIKISYQSFVGVFSNMSINLPDIVYKVYLLIPTLSFVGWIKSFVSKYKKDLLFNFSLFLMCIISIGISVYYSYFNDFQAQGRYCFAMLIPINILFVKGIDYLMQNIKNTVFKNFIYLAIISVMMIISLFSLFSIYITVRY